MTISQMLSAVFVTLVLATFTVLLWRIARAYRARRVVRCPVTETLEVVTVRVDANGTATDVVSCSRLDPPHEVTCSQSCLHVPGGTAEHARA